MGASKSDIVYDHCGRANLTCFLKGGLFIDSRRLGSFLQD